MNQVACDLFACQLCHNSQTTMVVMFLEAAVLCVRFFSFSLCIAVYRYAFSFISSRNVMRL